MVIDYLVIGQGVCGSFLSYYLQKENKTILVIDNNLPHSPSRITAGIINPVTGRRMVTVWMADEVLPFAWKAYNEMGDALGITTISQKNIIDFFPNPFMRESFLKRINEGAPWLHSFPDQNFLNPILNYEFGCGEIRPVYLAHLETLLPAWRKFLETKNCLREEDFDIQNLLIEKDKITYKDIIAEKIIFCDGGSSVFHPFFKALPFAPNKGEALLLEITGLPDKHIYKKSMILAPMASENRFWAGSTYLWDFKDSKPTPEFRQNTLLQLQEWLKLPFKVVDHVAGIRPATIERRPFVGWHPVFPNLGILNGMGTKGCSLAPFFARQLVDNLLYNLDITPEADIKRFSRILNRQ